MGFECFAERFISARQTNDLDLSHEEISNTTKSHNNFMCIYHNSLYRLFSKNAIRISDMITEGNRLITSCNLIELYFSQKHAF